MRAGAGGSIGEVRCGESSAYKIEGLLGPVADEGLADRGYSA